MAVLTQSPSTKLDLSKRLSDVQSGYYRSMFRHIDSLGQQESFNGDIELYERAKYIIANYAYLVYERLELKIVRDVKYKQIRQWAGENQILLRTLLIKQYPLFEIAAFDRWVQPDTQMQKMGMYSPSTRQNKNFFH